MTSTTEHTSTRYDEAAPAADAADEAADPAAKSKDDE